MANLPPATTPLLIVSITLWAAACSPPPTTPPPPSPPPPALIKPDPVQPALHKARASLQYAHATATATTTTKHAQRTTTRNATRSDTSVDVYILAGQSNMDGYALQDGLPGELKEPLDSVQIYWPGRGDRLTYLTPSAFDGLRFGPEVTFGHTMRKHHPKRRIVLVKYAVGGSDLHRKWYPGTFSEDPRRSRIYKTLLNAVERTDTLLRKDGYHPTLRAMLWMQGENDGIFYPTTYRTNLERFIDRVREDLQSPTLPFIFARIHCPYMRTRTIIRNAQESVHASVHNTSLFETSDLTLNDFVHYDAQGIMTLGERFAHAVLEFQPEPLPIAKHNPTTTSSSPNSNIP